MVNESDSGNSTSSSSKAKNIDGEIVTISDDDEVNVVSRDISPTDKNTSLHFSAAHGLIEIMKVDLEVPDQKIDAENFLGWTPLMMAVRNGKIEAVQFLLDKGADVTKKNKYGLNIFSLSVAAGNIDLMKIVLQHMLQGGISRNRIQESLSPISLSILYKRVHLMEWLLDQGFDIDAVTPKTSLSPMMFAAALPSEEVLHFLNSRGAKKSTKNYMGLVYNDIIMWRSKGLATLMEKLGKKEKAPTEILQKKIISMSNKYLIDAVPQKVEFKSTENNEKLCFPDIQYKVPNNTPSSAVKIKTQPITSPKKVTPTIVIEKLSDIESREKVRADEIRSRENKEKLQTGLVNTTENKFHDHLSTKYRRTDPSEEAFLHETSRSYNPPFPVYIPPMNSPMCVTNMGSPLTPMTPVFMVSPYQQFYNAVGEVAQNSPMGFFPSPQNRYPSPSQQVFFAPQMNINEMNNYPYEPYQAPLHGFYNGSVFYQYPSTIQNV